MDCSEPRQELSRQFANPSGSPLENWGSCSRAVETFNHLFLDDLVAAVVWQIFARRFGIFECRITSISSLLLSWFCFHLKISSGHIRVLLPLLILWFIWKGRNEVCFQGGSFSVPRTVFHVEQYVLQLEAAKVLRPSHFSGDHDSTWFTMVQRQCLSSRFHVIH